MGVVGVGDSAFKICRVSFDDLLAIQAAAERGGLSARWTSEKALRSEVHERAVLLRPLLTESSGGQLRAYRCIVLFDAIGKPFRGVTATLDVEPTLFLKLPRLDRDDDVRAALVEVFDLAIEGIRMTGKA